MPVQQSAFARIEPAALREGVSVNRFRQKRGRLLRQQIDALADRLGRDIVILDVGGRPDYWGNLGVGRIARIDVMNYHEAALERALPPGVPPELFTFRVGDARSMPEVPDGSIDLVHSNSVVEHVGRWNDMRSMARELLRVGRAGWVQTPAWCFPIEPHFRAPFLHWFGEPLRARMFSLSLHRRIRRMDLHQRRNRIETANLLSRREVEALFPGCPLHIERFLLLTKSYTARWMPDGPLARRLG
jgi:hypothetical protein